MSGSIQKTALLKEKEVAYVWAYTINSFFKGEGSCICLGLYNKQLFLKEKVAAYVWAYTIKQLF